MRSGSSHCDLQLSTMKHEEYEEEEEEDEETRARVTLIKSSNPHLAGGEIPQSTERPTSFYDLPRLL